MCHVCWPCHGAGIVSWSRNIYTPIFLLLGKGQSRPISPALLSLVQGCSSSTPINIYIPSIPCRIPSPARDFTGCFVLFVVQQLCHGCSDREFPGGHQGQGGPFPSGCAPDPVGAALPSVFPEWVWSKGCLGIPPWMLGVQRICSSASPEHSGIRSCFQKTMDL